MKWLLLLVVIVFIVSLLASLKQREGGSGTLGFPYQRAKPLFSAAERSFLGVLDQAVGSDYRVFGKVRVADLAVVKPGLGPSARQGAQNRIGAKHVDFVVCRADDLSVVCAIELNDQSHSTQKARARDDLLANVFSAIGVPLLTVQARATYQVGEVREQFLSIVEPRSAK